jgi:hypothetical protein
MIIKNINKLKMKKIITAILLLLLLAGTTESQVKVSFTLANPRIQSGYFMYDLTASIPAGQAWHVGSCNFRVNFSSVPANVLTPKADNPAINANTNISGANGYQAMTTTSILSGTALSLNILTFNTSGFYTFTPGTYVIGTMRWTVSGTVNNTQMNFRVPPATYPSLVFDSLTQLIHGTTFTTVDPVATNIAELGEIPTEYQLYQNYPNPFNPATTIKYDVPGKSFVEMKVYDITGRLVSDLINQEMEAGRYELTWNAAGLSSGIYFYIMKSADFREVKRMILLK